MESEWHRNVPDLGVSNAWHGALPGYRNSPTIAAYLLADPSTILTNVKYGPHVVLTFTKVPLLGDTYYASGSLFVPTLHPHFPYGYAVAPDVHG